MKKAILAVILIIFTCYIAFAQSAPIDLIVLLDTSTGMSSSYEDVNKYLTGDFLSEFLRVGDTIHFIAFSEDQKLDIARRINSIGDVETVIGRMMLQYPIETGRNVNGVLEYAEQYIATLPFRPKKVVLISVGDSNAESLVNASRQNLRSSNTTIDYVQVFPGQPLTNLPRSGRTPITRTAQTPSATTQPAQTQMPSVTTPSVQTQTPPAAAPSTQTQTTPAATQPETQPDAAQPVIAAVEQTVITPPPDQSVSQTTPSGVIAVPKTANSSGGSLFSSMPFIIALIILALLILGLIIFFASRKLGSNPSRAMSDAASLKTASAVKEKAADHSKDLAKFASTQSRRTSPYDNIDKNKPVEINPDGPVLLNLFVDDQNTNIGKRNIHSLKSGYKLTVGGGKSDDFLIFLVPMPSRIGEIRRNGSELVFTPSKPKYFPDIGSSEVRDCINKSIRIISDKNYEMRFRFEMYEDPLIALNRMLMSLKVPV